MNPLAHPDYYIIRTLYYIRTLNFCILLNAQCTQCNVVAACRMRLTLNRKIITDDVIIYFLSTRTAAL